MRSNNVYTREKYTGAFVHTDIDGQKWTIGTGASQLSLEFKEGQIYLTSYQNKLSDPPREYLDTINTIRRPLMELNLSSQGSTDVEPWHLEKAETLQISYGGRPAVKLKLILWKEKLRAELHLVAFPHTPIIRQWFELENTSSEEMRFNPANHHLLEVDLKDDGNSFLTLYWLAGDHPSKDQDDQGMLYSEIVTAPYHHKITGNMSAQFTPWIGLLRSGEFVEGMFAAIEYLGNWEFSINSEVKNATSLTIRTPDVNADFVIVPGERLQLPTVTLGVFLDNLEEMSMHIYNWQYEYLWGYTTDEYYALTQWASHWWGDSTNLQENFAGRLGWMDVDWSDKIREAGIEVLWDDAGWSEARNLPNWSEGGYGGIWYSTYQGPDFSQTMRYLQKSNTKWVLWFCGHYSSGLMDSKVGAWGNFQWRTDSIGSFNLKSDQSFRTQITSFLWRHPHCSLQTCNGGGSLAHLFDIQNYSGNNYFSDLAPHRDTTNYYFSYLDPPDKWGNIITSMESFAKKDEGFDFRETLNSVLTMTPVWYSLVPGVLEELRNCTDLYRYLLREGVAGRWSYVFHPRVDGDKEYYYFQRMNYNRTKGVIILKHKAPGKVIIYPIGLLHEHTYVVDFESARQTETRTGADLMDKGISIEKQMTGELVYIGLPNRPRSGRDKVSPQAPGFVFKRRETNIGNNGIGVYWSPGADDNWISFYEVRRGKKILGKVCIGTYFFDHSLEFDPEESYAIRTVDGDGNVSDWCEANPLPNESYIASALGGHFAESGRDGWKAEFSYDGRNFKPMKWVPPANSPAADFGGTARQSGGVEGYWEAEETARVGRGWQQASKTAKCIRTWVVPKNGLVRIIGRAMKEYYRHDKGNSLHVQILHNENAIWAKDGWSEVPLNDLVGATHDLKLKVNASDKIRFMLDSSGDPENDIVAWMPQIVYLNEEPNAYRTPDRQTDINKPTIVRILCGASKPYIDQNGNEWSADYAFSDGKRMLTSVPITGAMPTLYDQTLYQSGRCGKEFTYSIPVAPGLYTVRLKFAEPEYEWSFLRPFNLEINGKNVLRNFDVCWIARGPRKAYERVFRYLVPNADGHLVLHFSAGFEPVSGSVSEAMVQAIEVLPERKPELRLNVGSNMPFIDWNGFIWDSDAHFEDGQSIRSDAPLDQASPTLYDQALYQTARISKTLRYSIPVLPGIYTVHLKFAELWQKELSQRPMNIEINGKLFWEAWDPATVAGRVGMAIDLRAENITPDKDGLIILVISAVGENEAILQGIEIE